MSSPEEIPAPPTKNVAPALELPNDILASLAKHGIGVASELLEEPAEVGNHSQLATIPEPEPVIEAAEEPESAEVVELESRRTRVTDPETIEKIVFGPKVGAEALAKEETEAEARDLAFFGIMANYKNHPLVERAVLQLNNGKKVTQNPLDTLKRYVAESGQYDMQSYERISAEFANIERGIQTYQRLNGKLIDISPEDEASLIKAAIGHQVVYLSNLRLVMNIARQYKKYYSVMPPMDMIQNGNIGLAKAIRGFDATRGFKFSTYATWWIRQNVTKGIAEQTRNIRIPVYVHAEWLKLHKTIAKLTVKIQRQPNVKEIAEFAELSTEKVVDLLRVGQMEMASLDAPISYEDNDDGDLTLMDTIIDEEDEYEASADYELAQQNLDTIFRNPALSLKEMFIISFRFDIDVPALRGQRAEINGRYIDYDAMMAYAREHETFTLEAAGRVWGITRERIRQVESRATIKIKQAVLEAAVREYEPLSQAVDVVPRARVGDGTKPSRIVEVSPMAIAIARESVSDVLSHYDKPVISMAAILDVAYKERPSQHTYEMFKQAVTYDTRLMDIGGGDFRVLSRPELDAHTQKRETVYLANRVAAKLKKDGALETYEPWQISALAREKIGYLTRKELDDLIDHLVDMRIIADSSDGTYAYAA